MNCARCNNAVATHYVVDVSGGVRRELYICKNCVMSIGLTMTWPITASPLMDHLDIRCECGMTLAMFCVLQRMGCPKCYDILPIDRVISQYHNSSQHLGKIPIPATDDREAIRERISTMMQAMESAIRSEQYERAAYLRDQLKRIEDMDRG